MLDRLPRKPWVSYGSSVLGTVAVTVVLLPFRGHINATTVALAFLLVVLFTSIIWGRKPALVASLLGAACFNFFFIPPIHTFNVSDPQNWWALIAFFITAMTVGELSGIARRRANEAETQRREIKDLYEELHDAFDRASEAEAVKRSEQLKSALLDAVTHDIRTPLTSIKASATLLLEDATGQFERLNGDEQREMLRVINNAADRLDRFVEGIVDLARIESGDMSLHRNWGAVEEIVDAALAQSEPLTRLHRIELLIENELPVVRVDARAVTEVIYTLIDNASKYAPPSTTIKIEAKRAANDMVKIAVEDEGPGIPVESRKKVFERFVRITNDGSAGGIGMGLAIAKGIVDAHGGDIWIEEPVGNSGTRFVFTVPVGDEDPPENDNHEPVESTAAREF